MTASPDSDPVRAAGPSTVRHGDPDGPKIIVLDPAGAGKHDELPATWRPFSAKREIIWCRLPSMGALEAAEDVLAALLESRQPIDIVASGPVAEEALSLAERHPGPVRYVLLVDPAAHAFLEADRAEEANEAWEKDNTERIAVLAEAGVEVRVIAHSTGSEFDRVPAPLPLGHPNVVAALRKIL